MVLGERPETVASLRDRLDRHPQDVAARLRLATLLVARAERPAARALLESLESQEGPARAQAIAELAILDEAEGSLPAAAARWERLLADDIDHPEARAHLSRLRGDTRPAIPPAGAAMPTLVSPLGVKLLRYELVREIGRGATSTVYLALDQSMGISLALKVLHPQLAAAEGSETCRRFFQEARVVAGLRHPGVVAIYDLDEEARALVMELLPGGTLREHLRARLDGPRDTAEVRAMARDLLSTLAYLHGQGVVHGDITPRNILLRGPGAPVLADFGNARLAGAGELNQPAGTPIYLAPEQLRGAEPSPETDLFAVGAILWEALAGRSMRSHADLRVDRFAPSSLPPEVVAELPATAAGLVSLVAALTSSEAGERPTAEEACHALRP